MALDIEDREIVTDQEGYLLDPSDWDEAVAQALARQENLELTDTHWSAIRFMRAFFEEHQVTADVRHVTHHLSEQGIADAKKSLFDAFPYGYVKQACRIAGMRKPRAWSTG